MAMISPYYFIVLSAREKGRYLTQSYDKIPCTSRNVKRTKQRNKKFDYTAIADRLMTVSGSNYGHPTGLVNRLTGPTFPLPQQPCNQKDTHLKIHKQTNSHPKRRGHKNRYTYSIGNKYYISKYI